MSRPSENQKNLNNLLKNQENNVLVDIHSCPIEPRCYEEMKYAKAFIFVPRDTYVILISDLGQNKTGEKGALSGDREMYVEENWPWRGDRQITKVAQIYYPGDKIFNAEMMFGTPGDPDDEFFDIVNIIDGTPAQFNKSDRSVEGKEQSTTFSRYQIFNNLRDGKKKIIYITTCDPRGDRPNSWTITQWNNINKIRIKLQEDGRERFRDYVKMYGPQTRTSSRQRGKSPMGRDAVGVGIGNKRPGNLGEHFDLDMDSNTPLYISHVSKNDTNKRCITPCDYKTICNIHNAPLIGNIAKMCARKYCKTRINGNDVECIAVDEGRKSQSENQKTSTTRRRKSNLRRRRSSRRTGNPKIGGGRRRKTKRRRKSRKCRKTKRRRKSRKRRRKR